MIGKEPCVNKTQWVDLCSHLHPCSPTKDSFAAVMQLRAEYEPCVLIIILSQYLGGTEERVFKTTWDWPRGRMVLG